METDKKWIKIQIEDSSILLDGCKIINVHTKIGKAKTRIQGGFKETLNIAGKICKKWNTLLAFDYLLTHCKTLGNRCKCHGSSVMTIVNVRLVSSCVWHVKEPSLLNGHECRAWVKICSPSLVTSPYEWNIIEWYEKLQRKQNKNC